MVIVEVTIADCNLYLLPAAATGADAVVAGVVEEEEEEEVESVFDDCSVLLHENKTTLESARNRKRDFIINIRFYCKKLQTTTIL
jgi:hypothetical protein